MALSEKSMHFSSNTENNLHTQMRASARREVPDVFVNQTLFETVCEISFGSTRYSVMRSAESSGKGMTETLRGVYSLTETIGNGKTMLTFRSPETLRRPLASETVSDWII